MKCEKRVYGIILICAIIFVMTFILSDKQATVLNDDLAAHMSFATWDNIKSGELIHFGWHIIVLFLSCLCSKSMAASIVNALFNAIATAVCFIVLNHYLSEKVEKRYYIYLQWD